MARDYTLQALRATTANRLADTPADGEFVIDTTLRALTQPYLFTGDGVTAGGVLADVSGGAASNLYSADGILTGTRLVSLGGTTNSLTISHVAGIGDQGQFITNYGVITGQVQRGFGATTNGFAVTSTECFISAAISGNGGNVRITAGGINLRFIGTGALEINSAVGTAGQMLQSNGPGVAPTWESRIGGWAFAAAGNDLVFTSPSGRTITFNDVGANVTI